MTAVNHWVSSSLGRAIDLERRMVAAALAPIQDVLYDDYVFPVWQGCESHCSPVKRRTAQ